MTRTERRSQTRHRVRTSHPTSEFAFDRRLDTLVVCKIQHERSEGAAVLLPQTRSPARVIWFAKYRALRTAGPVVGILGLETSDRVADVILRGPAQIRASRHLTPSEKAR